MEMNRRNVLIGLSTAAAGSSMVFGSGAFTQVQATRSISVQVDDDSASAVGLEAGAAPQGGFASISANEDNNDGAIEFNLDDEALNTNSTLTIGDSSVSAGDLDSAPASQQVAFIIQDNSTFTDQDTTALGVQVNLDENTDINEIEFAFQGDSDNSALDQTATDNSTEGGINWGTLDGGSDASIAETGDSNSTSDTTAQFVLNSNSPGSTTSSDSHSGVAACIITLDTSNSGTGNTKININATITAEAVDMTA